MEETPRLRDMFTGTLRYRRGFVYLPALFTAAAAQTADSYLTCVITHDSAAVGVLRCAHVKLEVRSCLMELCDF